MIVFIHKKLAILAMPKTGTTAIEQALSPIADVIFRNPPGIKHTNLQRFNRLYRKSFESASNGMIETVAVIREPVDWLGSWYRYRSRDQLANHVNSTAHVDFETFVQTYLSGDRPDWAKVGDQARFLDPKDGEAPVTHLFQYEQMPKYVSFLEQRLGISMDLPFANVSPKMDLTLSPKTRSKLEQKCSDQFTLWQSAAR